MCGGVVTPGGFALLLKQQCMTLGSGEEEGIDIQAGRQATFKSTAKASMAGCSISSPAFIFSGM